jgi:AraC-like DNA-binding protein
MHRLAAFYALMSELSAHTDYRLLSSVQLQCDEDDASLNRIEDMLASIMDKLHEEISASQMADRMGMSESQFSRYFKKATGNTFTDFVNRVRINRACQLLMETDQLVVNICYEVGFNNVANFNRRFMDIKGMTPTEFRRQSMARFKGAA